MTPAAQHNASTLCQSIGDFAYNQDRMNRRRVRLILVAVGLLLASVAISACGVSFGTDQPTLTLRDVIGAWSGPEGKIAFSTDGKFVGHDLHLAEWGCPRAISESGTWEFLSEQGLVLQACSGTSRAKSSGCTLRAKIVHVTSK